MNNEHNTIVNDRSLVHIEFLNIVDVHTNNDNMTKENITLQMIINLNFLAICKKF